MEPNDNNSCESSFCRDEKVEEAVDLLEECWFFDNLLHIRRPTRMPRCHSDPYPSSNGLISSDFLRKDSDVSSYSSPPSNKPSNNSAAFVHHPKKMIQRAPSMPSSYKVREEDDKKGSSSTRSRSKLVLQPSDPVVLLHEAATSKPHCAQMKGHPHRSDCNNNRRKSKLLRTPSLPPSIGREEKFQETDHRTGRSRNKQPSTPTHMDNLPPRQTSKVL